MHALNARSAASLTKLKIVTTPSSMTLATVLNGRPAVFARANGRSKRSPKLGVDLSSLSHKTTAKVLRQQTKMMENQLDALAGRLRTAAQARSLTDLVRGQIRLIPENASQFVKDSRATLGIVADAGSNVRDLFGETASEFRNAPRPAAKKTARRAAKKTAKTVASAKKRVAKPKAKAA